jgi:hypothetical protein
MKTYTDTFLDEHRYINVDYDWWDCVYDDFTQICGILGIQLEKREPCFSGFWSQGDGASWEGTYLPMGSSWRPDAVYDQAPAKIREHAPEDGELHRIADELCFLARLYGPVHAAVRRGRYGGNYVHSNTMQISHWEYYDSEVELDEVDSDILNHIEETLLQLFRDLADWLYKTLEREYDYLISDEAVAESLEANEIEEETDDEDEDDTLSHAAWDTSKQGE